MAQFLEVVWSSLAVYLLLIILARIIGKKLLSQMTYFDFVIAIVIGTVAGSFIVNLVKGFWVLLSPIILTALTIATGYLTLKNLAARKLLAGEPVIVVHNGKVLEHNMLKLRYNIDDLEMQLRQKDVFDIKDVEFAVFEPHGQFSVLKKYENLSATKKDLGLAGQSKMATEIIKDGDILQQNLSQNNLDMLWLEKELGKMGIMDVSEVFYAALQSDGTLYIDLKQDILPYIQKVEDNPESN